MSIKAKKAKKGKKKMKLKTDLIDDISAKFEVAREATKKNAKAALAEVFESFFGKYSTLKEVVWTQYTPHFNDGEPCTFGVHDVHYRLSDTKTADKGGDDLPYYEWPTDWNFGCDPKESWFHASPVGFHDDAKIISRIIQNADDICETAFGDGVKVSVTRSKDDGVRMTVEDHDHD
jgi:hypothetical protein